MASDHDEEEYYFCEKYLVLKPEQASCFDLLRILCSKDLATKGFLNTPVQAGSTRFPHRWVVFISVLLQKVLLWLDSPMAVVGSAVELLLNLPAANGGHRRLLCNLLRGRLVIPNKSSESFTSIAANVDKRFDLDESTIRNEKYNSSVSMMASKLSYENQPFVRNVVTNNWKMEFMEFYNFWNGYQQTYSTTAIMLRDKTVNPNLIIIAFRGTQMFIAADWRTDVDISWYDFPGIGKIHSGFAKALGLQRPTGWPKEIPPGPAQKPYAYYTLRDKLRETRNARFLLTGHSLGGALAILFAGVLAIHGEDSILARLDGVYTFGQPRVGDGQFGQFMTEKMSQHGVEYSRFVYSNDVVPRLPFDNRAFMFEHFGPCLYFNPCYKARVLEEEPNKNYFSLVNALPKVLTAAYQLVRGFVLPRTRGGAYREGWLMKLLRVTALFFPGLTDHVLVDYVNLTRLGNVTGETSAQRANGSGSFGG